MNIKAFFTIVKKRGITVLLLGFLLLMIFSPGAKAWLLQQLVSVGLFKAEIIKEGVKNVPENVVFSFTYPDGRMGTTAGLMGKVVFINFWASWCPPCLAEMPSMYELYTKLKDDDRFVFLFMNEDEDKSKAVQYLEENHFTMPLYNHTGNIPNEIFNGTLPTTIIINKEGKLVLKHEGMAGYNTDAFMKQLKELL